MHRCSIVHYKVNVLEVRLKKLDLKQCVRFVVIIQNQIRNNIRDTIYNNIFVSEKAEEPRLKS